MKTLFKIVIIFVLQFSTQIVNGQIREISCAREETHESIYTYLIENDNLIDEYISDRNKPLFISVIINEDFQFESVKYYQSDGLDENWNIIGDKVEVEMMNNLTDTITSFYEFCPISISNYDGVQMLEEEFFFYNLQKDSLEKWRDNSKGFSFKEWEIENKFIEIPYNSNYFLKVDSIKFNKQLIINESFEGKLDYYNSNPIKLADNFYLHFKISLTSEEGIPVYLVDYNLYHVDTNNFNVVDEVRDLTIHKSTFTRNLSIGSDKVIQFKIKFE